MTERLAILIPVRPTRDGKQRLAQVMSATEREALNAALFRRTLHIAGEAAGFANCYVVTRAPDLLQVATDLGAHGIPEEEPGGHNAALAQASAVASRDGATTIIALSCDMPFLTKDDILAMLATEAPIVVATDEAGTGTNALLLSPPGRIAFAFGPGSAARHLVQGGVMLNRPGLAFDLDTPADLQRYRALSA